MKKETDTEIIDLLKEDARAGIEEPEPGYWEGFPARVRQRIAAQSLEEAARRPRLRAWILAPLAGALLVLAVVYGVKWIVSTPGGAEREVSENVLPADEWPSADVEVWEDVFVDDAQIEDELVELNSDELDAVIVALEDMRRS